MNARPQKTLADYLVGAVTPALIVVLVASVSLFILELLYPGGTYQSRLRWTICWFVLASVLVSRISITQGYGTASVYGLFLGGATVMFIFRFFGAAWGALGLLAFIWWCSGKMTWDCTLIDDEQDASGEGLLQAARLDNAPSTGATGQAALPAPKKKNRKRNSPHAPGMWVIYFSLVALPAFGIGQALFPREETSLRTYGFQLLAAYVVAALALLLSTSFLGLRRYLRQRGLPMPGTVSVTWMTMGAVVATAVLLAALLLPRPDATWSVPALIERAQELARDASQYATVGGDSGENEGRPIGEDKQPQELPAEEKRKKTAQEGQPDAGKDGRQKSTNPGKQKGAGTEPAAKGNDQPQPKAGEQQVENMRGTQPPDKMGASPNAQPPPPPAGMNERAEWIGRLVKWLLYALLALGALWLAWAQRRRIAALWRTFCQRLAELWQRLFGGGTRAAQQPSAPPKPRPFAEFANPFASGTGNELPAAEVLAYTYSALEAWAVEQGVARSPELTPNEFAATLSARYPGSAEDLRHTARHYSRLTYARREPPETVKESLKNLWRLLESQPG
jgi:hypothetical protein